MGTKKKNVIIGAISTVVVCLLVVVLSLTIRKGDTGKDGLPDQPESGSSASVQPEQETTPVPENKEYLSITYTTSDSSTETGRMMNFYTYDVASHKLENHAQIPFLSAYALGTVDLSEKKIYYTKSVGNTGRNVDHLFEYDMKTQVSTMLEDVNCAYNDICLPGNGKLLVTSIPVHAVGTGIFDIATKKFSYLYKMEMNEDGYEDFLWTTVPTRLNYNGHYGNFVNVSILEKTQYDDKVRSGKRSPNYQIDLIDADLNTKYKYTYTLKSEIDYTITAVTQIAQDQVLLLVKKDLGEESELEFKSLFYIINYTDNSCKKVKSPFPKMLYIDNYITIDGGKSYYVEGWAKDGRSGLFFYDCIQNTMEPILLDEYDDNTGEDNHIVNFSLVTQ